VTLSTSYRWIAPIYDWVVAAPLAAARRASLAQIPASGCLRVLISGAGTGLDLLHVPRCHRYIATDLVQAMLVQARPRAQGLDCALIRADSTRLPFASSRFDVVVLHLIVAVVSEPSAVLAEAARVTRAGGTVLVLDKFLTPGGRAPLRRLLSPLAGRIATRIDVVFEQELARVPGLQVVADQPALAGGWFRRIMLRKCAA
jgi:ubiquinone/menaquinone biosynthesis C-methylase UbiE